MAKPKRGAKRSPDLRKHPKFVFGGPGGKEPAGNPAAAEHKHAKRKVAANRRKRNKGKS